MVAYSQKDDAGVSCAHKDDAGVSHIMRVVVQLLAHGHAVMLLVSRYVMVPVNCPEHTVVIAAVVPMDRTRGADTPPWWSDCQLCQTVMLYI
jgi:hypothetical protein